MNKFGRTTVKILFGIYVLFLHVVLFLYVNEKVQEQMKSELPVEISEIGDPLEGKPMNTPIPLPTFSESTPESQPTNDLTNGNFNNSNIQIYTPPANYSGDTLMIPVVGIKRDDLKDTYNDSRSSNRIHNALDIPAPVGTPVVATADGEITKFHESDLGGVTIYQFNKDKTLVFYYAHLQRRADGIKEKDFVKQGTVIGYVGDTGNAGAGNYHLHFSISQITNPERFFSGTNINPYPILKNGIEVK